MNTRQGRRPGRRHRSNPANQSALVIVGVFVTVLIIAFIVFGALHRLPPPQPSQVMATTSATEPDPAIVAMHPARAVTSIEKLSAVGGEKQNPSRPIQSRRSPRVEHEIKEDAFTIESTIPRNSKVEVRVCAPVKDPRDSGDWRDQVLVMCIPYPTEEHFEKSFVFQELAKRMGFTVFGLAIKGMGPSQVDYDNRKDCYYYPESGSHAAYEAAAKEVQLRYNLNKRKLIVYGLSGGATAACILADARPDLVGSMASMSARRIGLDSIIRIPSFISHTFTDDGRLTGNNEGLIDRMSAIGNPPVHIVGMPDWSNRGQPYFNHGANREVENLAVEFMECMGEMANRETGEVPLPAAWPYTSSQQKIAGVERRKLFPLMADKGRPFPSEGFYLSWNRVNRRWATFKSGDGLHQIAIAAPPPGETPKGVVLMMNEGSSLSDAIKRDIMYLACSGYLAIYRDGSIERWNGDGLDVARFLDPDISKRKIYMVLKNPSEREIGHALAEKPSVLSLRYDRGPISEFQFRLIADVLGSQDSRIIYYPMNSNIMQSSKQNIIVGLYPGSLQDNDERREQMAYDGDLAHFAHR